MISSLILMTLRLNLDTGHCWLEKLVIIRTMIKRANIIKICSLVQVVGDIWGPNGQCLKIVDTLSELPSLKHWPCHCVLFSNLLQCLAVPKSKN